MRQDSAEADITKRIMKATIWYGVVSVGGGQVGIVVGDQVKHTPAETRDATIDHRKMVNSRVAGTPLGALFASSSCAAWVPDWVSGAPRL